ncbi:hypothetical protein RHMOL_Rhmol08G0207200 [Rhododendron molle]|uniref:Uncharacterized protein n=1 Tax=Rhododendron molle TaxID=49168 RepID=A0ACC0MQY5_RHOML|nr:hypothetical protein RHMOL_Rhmol08G0207200 [Rhododendron molle]
MRFKFLKSFPFVQNKLAKLFSTTKQSKFHFQTNHRPSRPNQVLKRHLKSNSTTKALLLFRDLLRKGISSIDSFSLLFVIKACTQKSLPIEGKQMHALIINLGFETNIFLQTSLIDLYSALGNIGDAHHVFEEIPTKNVVCWTALISGYVDNQKPNKALQVFRQMQMGNVEPDQVTLTVALSACVDLGALEMGEWIHTYVSRRKELSKDLSLDNALINMYAKCGDIETARHLFDSTKKKDVTTWTSMIVGHALHGQAEEALRLLAAMKEENNRARAKKRNFDSWRGSSIVPNNVTFIGVLMACSHAGMLEEGKKHFQSMIEDYGVKPRLSHFGCMVDLLCRSGLLQEAYDLIMDMPVQPNAVLWRTLLGACGTRGNIDLAAEARVRILELEGSRVGDNVIMSNIFAAKGMWDEKIGVREKMKQQRAPGCSSIEVGSLINEFVTADDDHPSKREIYEVLECLIETMKAHGYSPLGMASSS